LSVLAGVAPRTGLLASKAEPGIGVVADKSDPVKRSHPRLRPTRMTIVGTAANSTTISSDTRPGAVAKLARYSGRDNCHPRCAREQSNP